VVWLPWVPFHCDAGDGGGRQANLGGLDLPEAYRKQGKMMIIMLGFEQNKWGLSRHEMEFSLLRFVQKWDMQFLTWKRINHWILGCMFWRNLERKVGGSENHLMSTLDCGGTISPINRHLD